MQAAAAQVARDRIKADGEWRHAPVDTPWLAAFGVAGSLAAGAVVLGYYVSYWMGIRRRWRRHMGA